MTQFLELLPPGEALLRFFHYMPEACQKTVCIRVIHSAGRITAEGIVSHEELPAFPRSTVDGYAVRAEDTYGASESLPAYLSVVGEVPMGGTPDFSVEPHQAALIHTGGMLPEGADAVLMVEYTQHARQDEVELLRAVAIGENILKVGEDVSIGDPVISMGIRIGPKEIGGLLAVGVQDIFVRELPRIGIISCGDEVISPEKVPQPGQVRDINSYSLSSLISIHGGNPVAYGIASDKPKDMRELVSKAMAECDGLIITAGSSASTRDLTAEIVDSMGEPGVLVHGVNVRPGKPTILAICDGIPVIGLPGNPVSALVIANIFVVPMVEHLAGLPDVLDRPRAFILAKLTINLPSLAGREDWIPVRIKKSSDGYNAEPVFYKSNLIFTLIKAEGLAYIPADATGIGVGETVKVFLF
jgi:molybdopterin molybdotransferase